MTLITVRQRVIAPDCTHDPRGAKVRHARTGALMCWSCWMQAFWAQRRAGGLK